jgi:hypothetical protein
VTPAVVVLADLGLKLSPHVSVADVGGKRAGRVMVQTCSPRHYSIRAARAQDDALHQARVAAATGADMDARRGRLAARDQVYLIRISIGRIL